MKFTIESLQNKIPTSVYELLTTEDYMSLPLPKEEDIDKAYSIISPPYIPNWFPVSQRHFTEEEIKAVKSCTVVKSDYGLSMRFECMDGRVTYIPCSSCSLFKAGQKWYPWDIKLIELERYGETTTIWRVTLAALPVDIPNPPISKEEYIFRERTFSGILHRYYDLMKRDGKKISIFKYLRPY